MKFLIETSGWYPHTCSRSEEAMACSVEDVENIVFETLVQPGNRITWEDGTWETSWTLHSDRVHVLLAKRMQSEQTSSWMHRPEGGMMSSTQTFPTSYRVLSTPEKVLTSILETVVGDGVLTTYTA